MKSLTESIQESLLTEAQRIQWNKLSDEELFQTFWDHWSGYASNGLHSGTSSNAMAQRAEQEIYRRYPSDKAYDMVNCIIQISEYVCERDGIDEFARDFGKKAHDAVHAAIKANMDWIYKGEWMEDHKSEIKDK